MRVFAATVHRAGAERGLKPTCLAIEYALDHVSYFQRGGIKEFILFFSNLLVERGKRGARMSVKSDDGRYLCHVYVRQDGLTSVVVADVEYPSRVAFSMCGVVLDAFTTLYPNQEWATAMGIMQFPNLGTILQKYQNP